MRNWYPSGVRTRVDRATIRLAPPPEGSRDIATEHAEYLLAVNRGEQPEPPQPDAAARFAIVSLGGGWWLSTPLAVIFDDPTRPVVAELLIDAPDGRPRALEVTVRAREGAEVSAATLRVPVDEIVRTTVWAYRVAGRDEPPGTRPRLGDWFMFTPTLGEAPVLPRRGYVPRDPDRLHQALDTYNAALPRGRIKAVAKALNVSESTAKKIVRQARDELKGNR